MKRAIGKNNVHRMDPQRLGLLRRQFLGAVRREFVLLQSEIWNVVVTQDMFGLRDIKPLSMNTQWKYLSLDQQAENFQQTFKQALDHTLLKTGPDGRPWISKYIDTGYERGIQRTYSDTHRLRRTMQPQWYMAQQQQFLRSTLSSPQGRGKERLVTMRANDQLKGVTDSITQNLSRIVTVGLTTRVQPKVLGHRIILEIRGLTPKPQPRRKSIVANAKRGNDARSSAIVTTELSYAHSEGQLDAMAQLGLDDIEVMAEWVNGDNPCPDCEELESTIWKLEDAYGLIPRHPHCQCCFAAVDEERDWITSDWFT